MSEYVNAAVSSLDEGLVRQLLITEHCISPKDEKEFVRPNEGVYVGIFLCCADGRV